MSVGMPPSTRMTSVGNALAQINLNFEVDILSGENNPENKMLILGLEDISFENVDIVKSSDPRGDDDEEFDENTYEFDADEDDYFNEDNYQNDDTYEIDEDDSWYNEEEND
ncbi:hypothetical protein [Paenibacillus sp.]|uniref:hypothetical protein n=1 Tax=Paenibacillus sp. TaxID=58172 RepID=UPI0028AC39C9|nr:hypothetical protein [Paenibacillus sp.]